MFTPRLNTRGTLLEKKSSRGTPVGTLLQQRYSEYQRYPVGKEKQQRYPNGHPVTTEVPYQRYPVEESLIIQKRNHLSHG